MPSPARRTGGPCNAGRAGANTSRRRSSRPARCCPTGPPPGNSTVAPITPAPWQDGPNLIAHHVVSTREQWEAARNALLAREKELTRLGDELARERRRLPWVPIEKDYTLD